MARSRTVRGRRPGLEGLEMLERRAVPAAIDFGMALGVGAAGASGDIRANAVATDAAGNLAVVGSFRAGAAFDPAAPSAITQASGDRDLYVARYTPAGAMIWARTFPGQTSTMGGFTTSATAQASAVAVDAAGNLVVAGTFSGTVDFDPGSGVTLLSSPGRSDAFVLKLDASGRLLWARDLAAAADTVAGANAVALDGAGGAFVGGSFQERLTVGSTTLAAGGLSEAFVARFDANGQAVWAAATQGSDFSNAAVQGLAVDPSGNVVAAGMVSGTVDLDPGPNARPVTANGSFDAALWKLSSAGSFAWGRAVGGSDFDQATGVASDKQGNLYVAGTFSTSADFGSAASPNVLQAGGTTDAFLARYGNDGSPVWARDLAGSAGSNGRALGVAVAGSGRVHVSGTFSGTVDFDPGPNVLALSSVGYSDAFVAGYEPAGTLVYALRAGRSGSTTGAAVAVDPNGFASVVGSYLGATAFGPITVPAAPGGAASVFAARVTSGTATPAAPGAPALQAASDTGRSASDRITAATSLRFDVAASSGTSTVRLLRGGVVVAGRVGSGAVVDPGPLASGVYIYSAVEVTPDGIAGPAGASVAVTVDTVAPAAPPAPGLLAADDTGVAGDGVTAIRQPRVSGTAEANSTVQWVAADGSVLGTATASASGAYTVAPTSALRWGANAVRVRAIDAAGNVGALGATLTITVRAVAGDFDGDGKADPALFRPGSAVFTVLRSATGTTATQQWGTNGDIPVVADYDGDGKADFAVFRPSNGTFYALASGTGAVIVQGWGMNGDIPVPADYDGDGKADFAVFRPSNGTHYIFYSGGGGATQGWGTNGDIPVPADYDGDGRADIAVFRPSNGTFYLIRSATGAGQTQGWGTAGDVPVVADYDGDGKADFAVYRPTNGTFFATRSATADAVVVPWGTGADIPVPLDYDGDGKADLAVFRPGDAAFRIRRSTTLALTVVPLGTPADRPALGRWTS